jgi:nucleotide-binding universal stress UspA family protein
MLLRRILVPVDFSPRSRRAFEYAVALAELGGAALELLHVVPAPGALHIAADVWLGRELPHPSPVDIADAREHLTAFVNACSRRGIVPAIRVAAGDAAATIVRLAVELPADAIVMSTRSRSGVSGLVLGSVAERVIACAPCPVVALGREAVQQMGA